MGNKLSKKYTILIASISLLIFVLGVGLTYAWFSATVSGNDKSTENVIENATLSIKYTNSSELKGENIIPGWSETKTFTVENTGTEITTYNITWANLLNEFINKEDLVYTLTSDNNGGTLNETQLPETGENINILTSISIVPEVIQTYTLTITYKNQNKDQTSDTGKKLLGKIQVVSSNIKNIKATKEIISKYSESNTDGLIKLEQPATVQMKANTEYRYSGSNSAVKNYVKFNGNETWRIIGVFDVDNGSGTYEQRVKIMRDETIGNYSWDTSAKGINDFVSSGIQHYGAGINQWGPTGTYEGADLMRLLNPGYTNFGSVNNSLYWDSQSGTCYSYENNATKDCDFTDTGLKAEAKRMISDAKWYVGATRHSVDATNVYKNERSNTVGIADTGITITKTSNWTGKVGIPSVSDYAYASKTCYKNSTLIGEYSNEKCTSSNWMYKNEYFGTMIPINYDENFKLPYSFCGTYPDGHINGTYITGRTSQIHPSIYLNSDVKIIYGTGTSDNPYILSL